MSTYAQTYTNLLQKINIKYLAYNNLLQLKNYRQKVQCYKQNSKQPDLYYECFHNAELKILEDLQTFNKNYQYIQNEYKQCEKNCSISYNNQKQIKSCSEKCGSQYVKTTQDLYQNFYKTQLNSEAQFKKIKKN